MPMRLNPDDIDMPDDKKPLNLFTQSTKSERTRYVYACKLRQILCEYMAGVLSGTFEERASELLDRGRKDPKWTCGLMLNLAHRLRERTALEKDDPEYLSPTSVNANFAPLQKLFETNDVALPWKRVRSTLPEVETYETRGWTRDEIRRMLRHARGTMDRAIMLVMASSGVRIGGMELKWGHIVPFYGDGGDLREGKGILEEEEEDASRPVACAMLRVYGNTSAEYAAFITPEAYGAVQDYRAVWAREAGREPKPSDPFLKRAGPSVAGLTSNGIKQRAYKAIWSAGLRGSQTKEGRRYNVPGMNGFRRFCNKAMKDATSADSPISSLIKKERMLGHSGLVRLDKNYFKTTPSELAKEYLDAVPGLTIHETGIRRPVAGGGGNGSNTEDANVGETYTKPDPTPVPGTAASDAGAVSVTDDAVCPACGRVNRAHSDEEYAECIARVAKKALPSQQPDSGA